LIILIAQLLPVVILAGVEEERQDFRAFAPHGLEFAGVDA
jgi:hypothetical protein